MSERISQKQYFEDFCSLKRKRALNHALDIRKFEIDLYWKRATYFWAFIGATLAGYGAVQAASSLGAVKTDLSVVLSCLGIVFSFGWFCVNKGSKHWQENWENHVDMLEDEVIGPLYKIVLKRPDLVGLKALLKALISKWGYKRSFAVDRLGTYMKEKITGPSPYSVSKINQIISLFVTVLWLFLLYKSLPSFSKSSSINWEYVVLIGVTFASCVGFVKLGRTHEGAHVHKASKRKTRISPTRLIIEKTDRA